MPVTFKPVTLLTSVAPMTLSIPDLSLKALVEISTMSFSKVIWLKYFFQSVYLELPYQSGEYLYAAAAERGTIKVAVASNTLSSKFGQNAPRETLILGQQKKACSRIKPQEGKAIDFKLEQYAKADFSTFLHLDKPSIDDKLVQYWKEASPIVVQEGKST